MCVCVCVCVCVCNIYIYIYYIEKERERGLSQVILFLLQVPEKLLGAVLAELTGNHRRGAVKKLEASEGTQRKVRDYTILPLLILYVE